MFQKLAFMMQNNTFLYVSADTKTCPAPNCGISLFGAGLCGSPLSATSVAIVIIPNYAGMFNENRIFLIKIFTTKARRKIRRRFRRLTQIDADLLATKRHKMVLYKHINCWIHA
jgi:hypothetical protein